MSIFYASKDSQKKHQGTNGLEFITSTITSNNEIVPWLAAQGSLSYSPFLPPPTDYFFLYNFILPKIFHDKVNRQQHYWFGDYAGKKDLDVLSLLNFWNSARDGCITPIFIHNAKAAMEKFAAPMAIFKFNCHAIGRPTPYYLFMQHGSYLKIHVKEQPLLESGFVLLYRGIGIAHQYRLSYMPEEKTLINRYREILLSSLSCSVISFNTAHSSIYRAETDHLRNSASIIMEVLCAKGASIDLKNFLRAVNQSYTLKKELAEYKFGRSYVTFKTPVTNIRICSYFAGEYEVKVLSLNELIPVEAKQCKII